MKITKENLLEILMRHSDGKFDSYDKILNPSNKEEYTDEFFYAAPPALEEIIENLLKSK